MLPISTFNKFGYGLEFTAQGKLGDLEIDWKAIGAHLLALENAGKVRKVRLERIIITPDFHARLFREVPSLKKLEPIFI